MKTEFFFFSCGPGRNTSVIKCTKTNLPCHIVTLRGEYSGLFVSLCVVCSCVCVCGNLQLCFVKMCALVCVFAGGVEVVADSLCFCERLWHHQHNERAEICGG